tara:strand:- start:290 stop:478 length:189 start_codon:yes stop_codon:yes gene_type:complete
MARLDERLNQLEAKVDYINSKLDSKYVTQEEFKPIRFVVYGMVTMILMAVCAAGIALVIKAS